MAKPSGPKAPKYVHEGAPYVRITQITDFFAPPWLVDWKLRMGKAEASRISKEALKHGTAIHGHAEGILMDGDTEFSESDGAEVRASVEAFRKWREGREIGRFKVEQTLWDHENQVAGTYDLYLEDEGTLIDIKSSSKVSVSYFIQLGGYARMMTPRPKRLAVLRLDKTAGEYEYVDNESMGMTVDGCIYLFEAMMNLYKVFNKKEEREEMV